ncbi:hypothetical protein Tco_0964982, partial [Tanacetum coccineum]
NGGGKKEAKAIVFHKIETEEISDRFVASCFVNGLEAYDGEINLGVEENMISNEFAMKLFLEHELKRRNKVEYDVEPDVVFERSFLRLTKEIDNFENETVRIYPELDPFFVSSGEEKIGVDWYLLLDDLNFRDIPDIEGVNVSQFVCKMGKSSRNKRKYDDIK